MEEAEHRRALEQFLGECLDWLHAFEWNGTRVWEENLQAVELARQCSKPLISGGDRHACEPSACLNLTHARCFSEFADEVRGGLSRLLVLPQYREPMALRLLEASRQILKDYPEYPGREHWTDRFFYRGGDGVARPLSTVWNGRAPWAVDVSTKLIQFVATTGLRRALRLLPAERGAILP